MLGLPGMLLVGGVCRAQGSMDVWATWAASPFEVLGPEEAHGVLLYLHAEGLEDQPVALIFAEMARVAQWDVLEDQQAIRCRHRSERRGPPRVHIDPNRPCSSEWIQPCGRWRNFTRRLAGALPATTLPGLDAVILLPGSGRVGSRRTRANEPCPGSPSGRREDTAHSGVLPRRSSRRPASSGERWHRAGRGSWSWIVRLTLMADRERAAEGSLAGIATACWSSSRPLMSEAAKSRARDRPATRWAPKSAFRSLIPHSRECRSMPTRPSSPSGGAGKATTRMGPT